MPAIGSASVVVMWRSGHWLNIGRVTMLPPDWLTMSSTAWRVR